MLRGPGAADIMGAPAGSAAAPRREAAVADDETQFWYDLSTGQVDQGHQKGQAHLMGPYPSRADAQRALETARARTEAWDAEED